MKQRQRAYSSLAQDSIPAPHTHMCSQASERSLEEKGPVCNKSDNKQHNAHNMCPAYARAANNKQHNMRMRVLQTTTDNATCVCACCKQRQATQRAYVRAANNDRQRFVCMGVSQTTTDNASCVCACCKQRQTTLRAYVRVANNGRQRFVRMCVLQATTDNASCVCACCKQRRTTLRAYARVANNDR